MRSLSSKLLTFRGKADILRSPLPCPKVVFWPYLSTFREKTIFWDHLVDHLSFYLTLAFWPCLLNYQHFGEKDDILISLWRKFIFVQKTLLAQSPKLSTFRAKTIFCDHHADHLSLCLNWVFWPYLLNYQHFGERNDILRSFWINWFSLKKSFIGSISCTINISGNRRICWGHLE